MKFGLAAFAFSAAMIFRSAAAEDGVFVEGSAWETVGEGYNIVEGIAAAGDGTIYLTDVPDAELLKIAPSGEESVVDTETLRANGLAFGLDGRLYAASMAEPVILAWDLKTGKTSRIPLPSPANDLVITPGGQLYCTWGAENAVYHLDLADPKPVKAAELPNPNGITLSHDGRELWVGEFSTDTVRAFPILADCRLGPSRAAFKAKVPEDGKGLLDGMTPLADGRLLVGTALGLQILSADAPPVVIPNPTDQRANYVRIVTDAKGQRWIYAAHVKSVIRRRTLL
jgi:sugar lactone lactonase YvrE